MKLKNVKDVEAFMQTVRECEHGVWLKAQDGGSINLKSELSLYLGVSELLEDMSESLELFCDGKNDERKMIEFLQNLDD